MKKTLIILSTLLLTVATATLAQPKGRVQKDAEKKDDAKAVAKDEEKESADEEEKKPAEEKKPRRRTRKAAEKEAAEAPKSLFRSSDTALLSREVS